MSFHLFIHLLIYIKIHGGAIQSCLLYSSLLIASWSRHCNTTNHLCLVM